MSWKDASDARSKKILAVVGPTGVGKTALGIELAERFGGEIVNFDSVQVYRYLDIGTAKPTPEERARVPHHLIDILEPDEPFNAAAFVERADCVIAEIVARGKVPILVGGTGLYLRALLHGLFPVEVPEELRRTLRERLKREGLSVLYQELRRRDPEAARRIHPHDRVRVLRALEVCLATGKTFSEMVRTHAFRERRYKALKIGLHLPRDELYRRLNERVDRMLEAGLLEEVKALLERGFSPELKPLQSIGYRHMIAYLKGEVSLEEAVRLMKRDTRRYAKRQLTWFRADPEVKWFLPTEREGIFAEVERFLLEV
ncbi:tRNA (adenosine(37)-N6)-dimethylallyltransferase MiaA [Thermosulfurimonas sp. F29]|uniref:tRNA (adenosine(37)-N6)-dimethylallyltransferase MiaA n=1 Tax=Thermosulfurimonas sp. F29 TaxID=2867247 RepID=UPI001C83D07B|nr:tRNA (adenosine(37)-N6)-dimethylallyltransferase MiaA [Thermosulfurimonas sp. F29]MBX6423828.1 tRNA (adenosine(37)-N6)-dimethylallyltransferase MiaA [Thermosulfurimonas sp. F29]